MASLHTMTEAEYQAIDHDFGAPEAMERDSLVELLREQSEANELLARTTGHRVHAAIARILEQTALKIERTGY